MPYLFFEEGAPSAKGRGDLSSFPPTQILREFSNAGTPITELSHFEYFRLCLSSHYLTCGTPVPTDVDNQIRQKLWPAKLPLEDALSMADLVLASRGYDFRSVSSRYIVGATGTSWENEVLTGHLGEWFTVACGAYCAFTQYPGDSAAEKRAQLFSAIEAEVLRHSEIFASLLKARDGIGCLKASASIAHNFGDLDRVMDMWELSVGDPLRLRFYKLTAQPFDTDRKLRYTGRLWMAGELYKSPMEAPSSMALENHRHFALRKPRALRERPELVVPTAPFFDDWGKTIATVLGTRAEEIIEVLVEGWIRQPGTIAYGRALVGILKTLPEFGAHPAVIAAREAPELKKVLETSQADFEKTWGEKALAELDEIPSRAE